MVLKTVHLQSMFSLKLLFLEFYDAIKKNLENENDYFYDNNFL